jgi:Condensation domain
MNGVGTVSEVRRVPASVGQRLLWLLEQFRGEQGAANCPIVLRLRGALDTDRLVAGLTALAARHESLRTTVEGRGRNLAQLVQPPREVAPRRVDLAGTPDREAVLRAAVLAEIRQPIDVALWPTRSTLWRLAADDHVLCFNMHHAVTDGWSCGLVLRDLDLLTRADRPPLPDPGWQYGRFCEWQHEWLASERSRTERQYWLNHLAGARLPSIPLKPLPANAPREDGSVTADIDAGVVTALQRVARGRRTTLPAVMLAVYNTVLYRLTGDDDLAVASFLSNRTRPEVRETVGLLANMLVLRTRLHGAATFGDVLNRTRDTVAGAFVHQRLPYQLLSVDRTAERGRRPDDVMFQMVPQPSERHSVAGAAAEVYVVDDLGTRFECEFQLYPRDGGLRAVLFFNAARLDPRWAARLMSDYVALAAEVAQRPDVPLSA